MAGGAYLPKGDWLKGIRTNIDRHADELKKIINGKRFKQYFGELEGEKLKTAPREYSTDHPEIELLRLKSFLALHNLSDKQVSKANFLDHCTTVFEVLYPFDQFLNKAARKPA